MARMSRQPPLPQKTDESPRWHIGAPMMPELATELGRVVALWSRLERMMNGTICQLSGIGLNLGDVLFGNINMISRHLILEGVALRYLNDKDQNLCSSLIKCSLKIREYRKRNELVHGLWIRGGMDFAISEHASRKTHDRRNIEWTLEEITKVGDDISTFIMEIWGHIELIDELFPCPPSVFLFHLSLSTKLKRGNHQAGVRNAIPRLSPRAWYVNLIIPKQK
jgi:hypothetical protein